MSALAPLAGPLDAATPLLLRGINFAPLGDLLLCDLGGVRVAATFGDAATLRCDAPPLALAPRQSHLPGGDAARGADAGGDGGAGGDLDLDLERPSARTVLVAASSDGGTRLGSAQPFTYYDVSAPPTVDAVSPRLLPLGVALTLTLTLTLALALTLTLTR